MFDADNLLDVAYQKKVAEGAEQKVIFFRRKELAKEVPRGAVIGIVFFPISIRSTSCLFHIATVSSANRALAIELSIGGHFIPLGRTPRNDHKNLW